MDASPLTAARTTTRLSSPRGTWHTHPSTKPQKTADAVANFRAIPLSRASARRAFDGLIRAFTQRVKTLLAWTLVPLCLAACGGRTIPSDTGLTGSRIDTGTSSTSSTDSSTGTSTGYGTSGLIDTGTFNSPTWSSTDAHSGYSYGSDTSTGYSSAYDYSNTSTGYGTGSGPGLETSTGSSTFTARRTLTGFGTGTGTNIPTGIATSTGTGRRPTGSCPLVPASNPGNPIMGCSIVGVWTLVSSHGSVSSTGTIEFDANGGYYGGPLGADVTQSYAYDGAYSVSGSTFNLIESCGDGCVGSGMFSMQFNAGCALLILTETSTQCTGNRTAVAGTVILTRQ